MKPVVWLAKLLALMLLVSFAMKNMQPVILHYYLGFRWQAPFVLFLMLFFCAGVVLGVAGALSIVLKQRRQILQLRRELRAKPTTASPADLPPIEHDGIV